MQKWTEIRTAYRLAKLGTLSATAKELGIHRSTVMRHIDMLEEQLKVKLFQRNDKGYIPTEAGLEVMRLGEITDLQFTQFANRTKSKEHKLEGTLSITCVSELAQLLIPAINLYQSKYPSMKVDILGDTRHFNLEYGEADLAVRTGPKPQTLDNIVLPFFEVGLNLCAHQEYIEKYGKPTAENLSQHQFLALKEREAHLPWNEWIYDNVAEANIRLTSSDQVVLNYGLLAASGISVSTTDTIGHNPNLEIILPEQSWKIATWVLIHRDMIQIPKIRAFVDLLKANIPEKFVFSP